VSFSGCCVALLLAVHFVVGLETARSHNLPLDEFAHLPAGISYWQRGRFECYPENPPLTKLLAALPVLAAGPAMDSRRLSREVVGNPGGLGQAFLVANCPIPADGGVIRYFHLFFLGRLPGLLLSVVGGWLVFRWSRELYGPAAGTVALALWTLSPNVLAWAATVTADSGGTVAGLAASYAFWWYWKRPSWSRACLCGALLGVALLSKYTLLVLLGVWPALAVCSSIAKRAAAGDSSLELRTPWTRSVATLAQWCSAALLAAIVINAGYAFDDTGTRLAEFRFESELFRAVQRLGEPAGLSGLPVPLPKYFLMGMDAQREDFERGLVSYLRGEFRHGGWWYYYLYAMLVKEPLGTWGITGLAVLSLLLRRRGTASGFDEWCVLLPGAAVLVLVSSQTGFNHHLRYVLPAFPFWYILAGRAVLLCSDSGPAESPGRSAAEPQARNSAGAARIAMAAIVLCLVANVVSVLRIHPQHMSYFNELVGGPENGGKHLLDSNIDWGQNLFDLKAWLDEHPEARPLGLAYYGSVEPAVLGISYQVPPFGPHDDPSVPPSSLGPKPGYYAVSVNLLYGYGFPIPDGRFGTVRVPHGAYTYFQHFEPIGRAGYSMYLYHITSEQAERAREKLELPKLSAWSAD
jgi:4-amino-4-deoxy-L-arabinose transferase-like glycosyltransferase